jgi:hypothetical protein
MRRLLPVLVIVAVVSAVLGGVAVASHDFNDVPNGHPFHDDISWMAENGIANGFSDGGYHPDEPVSRQAMAAFLHRLSGEGSVPRSVDAARLAGRTASDFDNAVTLQGQTVEQLQPEVYHATSTAEVAITSSSVGSANVVVSLPSLPAGTYVVDVSGSYRVTGWEEAVVNCVVLGGTVLAPAHSLDRVRASTEENLSDWGHLSGTAVIDLPSPATVSLGCFWQGLSGVSGSILARNTSLIATAVEDL